MSLQDQSAPVIERDLFIGNEWRPSADGRSQSLVNPATEEEFGSVALASSADVDAAVRAARTAFDEGPWPRLSVKERADYMLALADEIERHADAITEVVTAETGLVLGAARGNPLAFAGLLRYYASLADSTELHEVRTGLTGATAHIEKRPVGVVAAIVPWNAPLGLAAFKLPPALLAGCTIIMKPSDFSPLSAGYVADAALKVGLPAGVINVLTAGPEQSQQLVSHPGVDKVTFTGSTGVGRAIAAAAAPTLKQVTLELGGKSPAVILPDADLDRIVHTLTINVCNNNGAVCTNPSRLIVPESRKDEIVGALAASFARVTVGDPTDPDVTVGPMINKAHYEKVLGFFETARQEGATFAVGGDRAPGFGKGYYVLPTIITDVTPDSRIAQEEIFGPVTAVLTYRDEDEDEAIRLANHTEFGLNAAVFSSDEQHALEVARRIHSGTVSINNGITIDLGVPFGGVKQSGYGRELGPEGLDAFYNTHAIFLDGEPVVTL
ncbi:aldehyde dehydrogenase [Streptomyces griseorubiginosus]|uniref:aldehyde dehydrogenase n=1 Tax=Streptomyces griseorubiginosus TaxID=67304 RepID=UPI002E80CF3F|nr:aldehyde dehydrogenase [Streptomyces griseorubiginosus]WUB42571.1 aldehyde dehydrogenase [Streptomyces griseorubiginosus]WUB51089.1 aldehyde dehydrogenase [Streptomyces griseorubiginosus]